MYVDIFGNELDAHRHMNKKKKHFQPILIYIRDSMDEFKWVKKRYLKCQKHF